MNLMETGKNYLEHFGVKGMRWGVRRTESQLKKASAAKDKATGEKGGKPKNDHSSKARLKGKKTSDLSDRELKAAVNRMNMEQQYAKLAPKSIPQKAVSAATGIAASVAKQQVTNLANDAASKKIAGLMKNSAKVPKPPNRFPSAAPNPEDRVG